MFATFRGPRATQLVLTTPPSGAVAGASFGVQPIGELRDARGARAVGCGGAVIRAELVSGPGALQGGQLATVDASGAFAFSTLGVTTVGTYSLRFVVVGFAPNATASGLVASAGGSISRGLASAVVRVSTVGITRVLTAGLGALDANQPSGTAWTGVVDTSWTSASEAAADGWGVFDAAGAAGGPYTQPSFTADATDPEGQGNVMVTSYAGVNDGWDPARYEIGWTGSDEMFYSAFVRFSSTFDFGGSGIKWILIAGSSGNLHWLNSPGVALFQAGINGGGGTEAQTPTNFAFNRDEWLKVQFWLRRTSARFSVWINDQLVSDVTGFSVGSNPNEIRQCSTWGGGNASNGVGSVRFGRTRIWRR
jgi:hypothetical protein